MAGARIRINLKKTAQRMAQDVGGSRVKSERYLRSFIRVVQDCIINNEIMDIRGFGHFEYREQRPRHYNTPKGIYEFPARTKLFFKVGKAAQKLVQQ